MSKVAEETWGKVWSREEEMNCQVALQRLATSVYLGWKDRIESESKYPDLVGLGQIHDIWNGMYRDMKALYTLERLVNTHYKTVIVEDEESEDCEE